MRNCEICGLKERTCENKVFFFRFPPRESVCKQWVQVVGKEDLAYLPIPKLHQLRYVCGKHFEKRDFTKSKTRLKKKAIPKLGLLVPPLSENILKEFPLKMAKHGPDLNVEHSYCRNQETSTIIKKPNLPLGNRVKRAASPVEESYMLEQHLSSQGLIDKKTSQPRKRKRTRSSDQETNGNPDEFKTPLSNSEKDAAGTGESNVNEKTKVDIRKSTSYESNPYAEGIPDFDDHDDQEGTFQNLQGSKPAQDPVFSWEKKVEVVPPDDGDAVACLEEKEALEDLSTEISLYFDDDSSPANVDLDKAPEYQCNECREVITGFRYTCVQCADWDLCAACEARAAHDTHYVLRVPGQRPYSEIQAVLAAIRQQILSENLFLNPVDDSLKMEIKSEPDDSPPDPEKGPPPDLPLPDLAHIPDQDPLPVPDPLIEGSPDSENSFTDSSEESDSDVDSPPSRTGTIDEPFTETDQPQQIISSDDSDGNHSPPRKRMRTIPNIAFEKSIPRRVQPVIVHRNQPGPSNTETQTRASIATKYRQLTKVYASQIPQQILANKFPVTSKPHAKLVHPVGRFETPTRCFQRGTSYKTPVRIQPNPATIVIHARKVRINPTEVFLHQKPGKLVSHILERGGPSKCASENPLPSQDPIIQRTDHQLQTVVALEPTEEVQESSEQLINEQPEFCLRLPPNTNEESLIQALQCQVAVRLERDF